VISPVGTQGGNGFGAFRVYMRITESQCDFRYFRTTRLAAVGKARAHNAATHYLESEFCGAVGIDPHLSEFS
jgi:hypothetical protein